MTTYDRRSVAKLVDHTILSPTATWQQVWDTIFTAKELGTYSACISPSFVPLKPLAGLEDKCQLGDIHLAVVCGFPHGTHAVNAKAMEAALAAAAGVDEIDMVVNLGNLKAHDYAAVEAEIKAVREAAPGVCLKVILETAALEKDEIVAGCLASRDAGANFVKTSTGFHPAGGASVEAIEIMAKTVGDELGVKASGGIRDGKFAVQLLEAGATRLGLSATAKVLDTL